MTQTVTVLDGPSEGQIFELNPKQPELTIGRDPSCSLVLESKNVSRKHALLRQDIDGVWIEDLKSKNGIRLNGTPLSKPTLLQDDAEIQIGDVHLRYSDSNAAILKKLSAVPAFQEPESSEPNDAVAEEASAPPKPEIPLAAKPVAQPIPSSWLDYVYIGLMAIVVIGLIVGALIWVTN